MNPITLVKDTIDKNDIDQLIEWLKTYPKLTKGAQTIAFEEAFSNWIGCKHSVFVNSGSSANLLMVYLLKHLGQLKNNKIVVPSLCWATDLAPVIQFGIEPILVDCNLTNLSVDLNHLEYLFETEKPDAMILVSVLGLSPDMERIVNLCDKYGVILIEDNCESQGTSYRGRKLGNFGAMSSFSTYFGHTMSTIEGGFITTNNEEIYNLLKMFRSHGWDRDLSLSSQKELRTENNVNDFDALYTFYVPGFNVRSTDLQAFIGIGQLKKVDSMIEQRNKNFKRFKDNLLNKVWFPTEIDNTYTASFCIPVIANSPEHKQKLIKEFGENGIECRPLISGTMSNQPFYKKVYEKKYLPNCQKIDGLGMYIPNHPLLTNKEIDLMCKIIIENIV